jgi:hypothetical protein
VCQKEQKPIGSFNMFSYKKAFKQNQKLLPSNVERISKLLLFMQTKIKNNERKLSCEAQEMQAFSCSRGKES